MAITPVPDAATVPDFPTFADRATGTYNSKAYAWALYMGSTFVTWIVSVCSSVFDNATEANSGANIATSAALAATVASNLAASASNFKGNWSALTGAQTKGISVKYAGTLWYLAEDVADITAWTPSTSSAKWIAIGGGPTPAIALAGATAINMDAGEHFTDTLTANRTVTVSNALSNSHFVLELAITSGTPTFPAGTVWPYNTAPVFTTGKRYLIYFQKTQIGTAGWYASILSEFPA